MMQNSANIVASSPKPIPRSSVLHTEKWLFSVQQCKAYNIEKLGMNVVFIHSAIRLLSTQTWVNVKAPSILYYLRVTIICRYSIVYNY